MRLVGILVLLLIAGAVLAIVLLPWQVTVGAIVLFAVVVFAFGGRILEAIFKIPFRAKGAVLRGAIAEVHSVAPTAQAGDGEGVDRGSFIVEVTIQPKESGGAFQLWEPGELRLVGPGAKGGYRRGRRALRDQAGRDRGGRRVRSGRGHEIRRPAAIAAYARCRAGRRRASVSLLLRTVRKGFAAGHCSSSSTLKRRGIIRWRCAQSIAASRLRRFSSTPNGFSGGFPAACRLSQSSR